MWVIGTVLALVLAFCGLAFRAALRDYDDGEE